MYAWSVESKVECMHESERIEGKGAGVDASEENNIGP